MLNSVSLTLEFQALAPFNAPAYAGSMLRGAFGAALKRTVCVMRLRDCEGCPLERACVYTTLFETRPPVEAGVMRLYQRAPQPFVLGASGTPPDAPTVRRAPGERLVVSVRLFGDAVGAAPFVLRAFKDAGQRGFGSARTPHALMVARDGSGTTVWRKGGAFAPVRPDKTIPAPLPDRTRWRIITPMRLKREGKLLTPDTLTAGDIVMAVVRRLGLLATFFGDKPVDMDFRALKAAARQSRLDEATLSWRELVRRSSRQKATLSMGGIVGDTVVDLGGDAGLAAALAWAPLIHVGKGASMGLGRVEVAPA